MNTLSTECYILSDYFSEIDIDAIHMVINSAIDGAVNTKCGQTKIYTDMVDIIKENYTLPEDTMIRSGDPYDVIIIPISINQNIDVPVVKAHEQPEANLLIAAYVAEKMQEANNHGWRDVTIPHIITRGVRELFEAKGIIVDTDIKNCTTRIMW